MSALPPKADMDQSSCDVRFVPFAGPLSDQDIVDLAAYYSYLPRLPGYHPTMHTPAPRG